MSGDHRNRPSDAQTIRALRTVGSALGERVAYVNGPTFYFVLDDQWALGLSPDDAGRFRLRACHGTREIATLWANEKDLGRLADLARSFKAEINALRR